MAAKLDVYGIGNALVDLQVQVPGDFLATLEVPKGQMLLVDDQRQAQLLAALDGHKVNRSPGGSAANTIVGVAEFGGTAGYCCRVAADDLGRFYVADMERLGIEVHGQGAAGQAETGQREAGSHVGQTGTSLVMITPDAQRTMMTNLAISAELGPQNLDPAAIARARYLYVEGYLFTGEGTKAAAMQAIEIAKQAGVAVALTVSDPFVINLCRDLFWELIEGPVDLLFCNEQEAVALTGHKDPIECAREIHRHAKNVALTLGPNGSILMHDNEVFPVEGVETEAIDTTGAGDMYAAGVLYGITHGMSWTQAGHLGSHAAARVVSQLGARLPTRFSPDEIAKLIDGR